MLKLDHIVLAAETLEEGTSYVEHLLGFKLDKGGRHEMFGTHNRLLSLGDCYFEVIALDPAAKPVERAVWYELDDFSGLPRLITWVCETDDMANDLAQLPYNAGKAVTVSRDDLIWDLSVADNGQLPVSGCAPSMINWRGTSPPTVNLPDRGCKLHKFKVSHPDIAPIYCWMRNALKDSRVEMTYADRPALSLTLQTPNGLVTI